MRPRFCFNVSEQKELELIRKSILFSFYHLHSQALLRGESLYNVTPKFHVVDHMLRRQQRTTMSAGVFGSFASEDFIGKMALAAQRAHGATVHSSVIERWLLFFWAHYFGPT